MENLVLRNSFLEERLRSLEAQLSKEATSRSSERSVSSQTFRGVCSVTFDVEDGSREGNVAALPAEPSSPKTVDSRFGQKRKPKGSRADRESQPSFVGAKDVYTKRERSSPGVAGKAAAGKTSKTTKTDVGHYHNDEEGQQRRAHSATEVSVPEEQDKPRTEPKGGRPGSVASLHQTGDEMSETGNEGVCDPHGDDGVVSEMPEEEDESKKEATEEDNQDQPCPADSSTKPRENPERLTSRKRDSRKTSGRGTGTPSQRDQDLSKENLRLASENLELHFQLEQSNKDLPRLKNQVADLKEMCSALKKEKAEVEKKLAHIRGTGYSGKTVPELEKTVGLMKKVVERVQRENETLKKSSTAANQDKVSALEKENEKLKADYDTLKHQSEAELTAKLESKTKGLEKIVMENERLRKENKREMEAAERMRMAKVSLEVTVEKLEAELEESKQKLQAALSRPITEGVDSKTWKASVVTRMFENKMKELEKELSQKTASISELKQQLKEVKEREERAQTVIRQLEDQVDMLKKFPASAKTNAGLPKEFQAVRMVNAELEKQNAELKQKVNEYTERYGETSSKLDYGKLQNLLQAAETEKSKLQAEVRKLKRELGNFDPTFFEELEDLKYNYNLEVKKNILLEEQLKKVCDRFGVRVEIPSVSVT